MNLIDKYLLRQFIMTLVFSILALYIIFLVVNLLENLDNFLDQKATFAIIVEYYIDFFPEILKILTPVAMLLSVLFTIGKMATVNEITAMKSGGLSLYRFMLPLLIFSFSLSIAQLYFNGWIVPKANARKIAIERQYLHIENEATTVYNLYFRDNPNRNVIMQYYSPLTKTISRIAIEDYSSTTNPRLIKRIEAETARWDTAAGKWKMKNAIVREFKGGELKAMKFDSMYSDINIKESQIVQLQKSQDEMSFSERKEYIELLSRGGKDVRKQMTDYYGDYAFPFANIIVVLFGVPFASIKKKGGVAIQIGAAMVISFTYLIFTEVSKTIGYSSNISPLISGWSANLIFTLFGLYVLYRTKT